MPRKALRGIAICGLALLATSSLPLLGSILRVPADHPSIKAAVGLAGDGDTVLVEDGVYLEKNIVIGRKITVRSKNLFGAVIYGSFDGASAIFIVKAAARIEGFVLKGGTAGIMQRGSPDVQWQAVNLAVFNCQDGLAIDDTERTVGSALIRNVAVIGAAGDSRGFLTNDAGTMDISDCLAVKCVYAFSGYDHLAFHVASSMALDCGGAVDEGTPYRPVPPATSRIEMGKGVRVWSSASLKEPGRLRELRSFLRTSVFMKGTGGYGSARDDAAREAITALIVAESRRTSGDKEAAAESYEAALAAGERAGSPEFLWQALIGKARLERPSETPEERIALYKRAVDHLESWIPEVPAGIRRINFLEDKTPAFEALLGLLIDARAARPLAKYGEEAFFYAEVYKTLSLQYPGPPREPRGGLGPAEISRKDRARKKTAEIQLRLQDPSLPARVKENLIASLEAAEEDYHGELINEERTYRNDGAEGDRPAGGAPSPLDFSAVRGRLSGRALLSYVLGESASFAFLATAAGLECARLPPAREIGDLVDLTLRVLQLDDTRDLRGAGAGRVLFDILLGPFAGTIPSLPRRIIVIPDGRLNYVPFEALIVAGQSAEVRPRFWGESAEFSYASSATQALAGPRPGRADDHTTRVLVVGNSGAIRWDNRSPNRKQHFPRLAHVREEVESVAGSFPGRSVRTLLDAEATEGAVKAADLAQYDIVHLAAHGVIDDLNWWRSALLLGPAKDRSEDGFFTALEIAELDVRARLVVLSACGTGVGSLFVGEGIKGLSGAFLRAGAEDVIVSLWNVDDKATSDFMAHFYRLLAGGEPASRALARTKTWLIGRGYRNPFFWAPFVLIGRADDL